MAAGIKSLVDFVGYMIGMPSVVVPVRVLTLWNRDSSLDLETRTMTLVIFDREGVLTLDDER